MNGYGNDAKPVMPRHLLEATKKTRAFKAKERVECFIQKMTDGRYSVMAATFSKATKHYEVFTETELHESFNEV